MKSKFLLLFFFLVFSFFSRAQDIDVQHYKFSIKLSDSTDEIKGEALIAVKFSGTVKNFALDLVAKKKNGKGMEVVNVIGDQVKDFEHGDNKLKIQLTGVTSKGEVQHFLIIYKGVPEDGLIISKNKYGDRTFFSDNWPNRAHHWLPCNDRPDDKATVDFIVNAPKKYAVVSNGVLIKDSAKKEAYNFLAPDVNYFHWTQTTPIPTKVMVIGAAKFAVKKYEDSPKDIPVTAWVYPQDSTKGFYDYALATDILKFFTDYIAPYPYQKLANVQSKTIFGGMENASAIFYSESSVTGDRSSEALIAHEIAHQWFGNTATEKNFSHLWLSEGFATYLTNIYIESKYGVDSFNKRLQQDRNQIINFTRTSNQPVVDSVSDYMDLLNANSYQKGGWILHMLRRYVGDVTFQRIIQNYYQEYKDGNADTRDFQRIAENASFENLQWFFDQWLYQPGIPELDIKTKLQGEEFTFIVKQTKGIYSLPMKITIIDSDGMVHKQTFLVTEKEQEFNLKIKNAGSAKISLDYEKDLLYQYKK